jgi:hypothetical protein
MKIMDFFVGKGRIRKFEELVYKGRDKKVKKEPQAWACGSLNKEKGSFQVTRNAFC